MCQLEVWVISPLLSQSTLSREWLVQFRRTQDVVINEITKRIAVIASGPRMQRSLVQIAHSCPRKNQAEICGIHKSAYVRVCVWLHQMVFHIKQESTLCGKTKKRQDMLFVCLV